MIEESRKADAGQEAPPAPRMLLFAVVSGRDLNARRQRLRMLRDCHLEHGILAGCLNLVAVHGVRQYKAPIDLVESAPVALILKILLVPRLLLRALPQAGQD